MMNQLQITGYYFGDGEAFTGDLDSHEFTLFYKEPRDAHWTSSKEFSAIDRDGNWMPFEDFEQLVYTCESGIEFIIHPGEIGSLYGLGKLAPGKTRALQDYNYNNKQPGIAYMEAKKYNKSDRQSDSNSNAKKIVIEKKFMVDIVKSWKSKLDTVKKAVWLGMGKGLDDKVRVFIQFGNDPTTGIFAAREDNKFGYNFTNEGNSPVKVPPGK